MNILTSLFWLSVLAIFYAYAGYPVFIWLLSEVFSSRPGKDDEPFLPAVSLLISAYNEEKIIEEKVMNSLSLNYPRELLEIIVISDGSTDGTNKIVDRFAGQGVTLQYHPARIGKTACLNNAVPAARGDIIVFSDANSMYDRDAVKHLVSGFSDKTVGFITGHTRYSVDPNDGVSTSVGIYAKIEKLTKKAESGIGSCVGADGALFAIRKSLYKPLHSADINDFVIPLSVIRQGFRGVLEEKAFCVEKTAGDPGSEVKRQIRITSRTLRAIFNNIALFNPFAYGIFSFELFSHKVAKFLAPFFALILVFCTLALSVRGTVYSFFLLAQTALLLFAWLGYRPLRRSSVLAKAGAICRTFVAMNWAIAGGWVQFLKGETYTTWSPAKR